MNWQKEVDYNQRPLIEAQIGRWKATVGGNLQARKIDNQTTETRVAAKALNRMTVFGEK